MKRNHSSDQQRQAKPSHSRELRFEEMEHITGGDLYLQPARGSNNSGGG